MLQIIMDDFFKLLLQFFISPGLPEEKDTKGIKIFLYIVLLLFLVNITFYILN